MPVKTTLAACVMAALSVSAPLAQSQTPTEPLVYSYKVDPQHRLHVSSPPAVMRACTEPDKQPDKKSCETWTWNGEHYTAQNPQGGIMVIEAFTKANVTLRITDPARPGLNGTIKVLGGEQSGDGNSIPDGIVMNRDGTLGLFQAYWGDALEEAAMQPRERTASGPISLPPVMHFCAQHCLTFTRVKDNELVNYTNLPGQKDEKRVFAIEKFTSDSVVIHRTDTGSYPLDSIMTGKMQYGDSSAAGNGWEISWGKELDQLPGDDSGLAIARQQPQQEQSMLMLLLLGAALFGDSPSAGSSSSGSIVGGPNRREEYQAGCAAGYSSACARIGESAPLGKP